jgi:DNA ligase (NAD+)
VGVDRTHRVGNAERLALPTECPSCGYRLSGSEPLVALRCENRDCPDQVVARVQHFASRAAVNIRGLGPRLIAKLVAQAGLRSPADLYSLTKERLLAIEGVGERGAEVLLDSIEASRGVELAPVVLGLGLDGVGIKRARSLAKAAPDLAALVVVGDSAGAEPPAWWTAWGEDANADLWHEVATEPVQALIRDLVAHGINPTGT